MNFFRKIIVTLITKKKLTNITDKYLFSKLF